MKKLPIRPMLSVATLVMASPAVFAQQQQTPQPAQPIQPMQQEQQPENINPVISTPPTQENPNAFQLRASLGYEHDSNVLRVPSASNPQSDSILTAGVGLKFDRRYSLQHLRADIAADTFRFQDHSDLNYSTVNYALGWDWSVTPRLHGVLSADRRQFREVSTDPVFATNLVGRRTERNEVAEAAYDFAGGIRALAGVAHSKNTSTEPRTWDASPDIRYKHVGAGYEFPSGTLATVRLRRGDGEYTDPSSGIAAINFRDTEAELALKWAITGKTTLDGRIAHLKREHSGAPQLDFSGMVGNATVNWEITGKTRLLAGVLRDLSATGVPTGGHVTSDRVFLAPVWKATGKTSFTARYDHTRRDWNDIPAATLNFGRRETIESLSVGADWEALRRLTVSPYLRAERMRSSVSGGYRATIYGIAAKAYF